MANWLDSPGKLVPGGTPVVPRPMKPCGFQQITSLSSATGLTVPANALVALIQAESQSVRWRDDGTNPTSSVGMSIPVNNILAYTGDLSTIKLIQVSASAIVNVSYYG